MTSDDAKAFARRLAELARDERRADRAVVKRARTGHPTQRLVARRVYHALMPDGVAHTPWNIDLIERVASLFVVNPNTRDDNASVGQVARELASRLHGRGTAIERRFSAILAAGSDTVDTRIGRLLTLAGAEGIGIDFARLTTDLDRFDHPDRFVQRRWADQYWGASTAPTESPDSTGVQP